MRVVVLGAGFMGGTHAQAWAALPDVEIAAIYAKSAGRAQPLAESLATRWTDELPPLLADASIDVVDVCLPSPLHREAAEAALLAGKHVLLEKPIALAEDDARAIVAQAEASGRAFMVAHVLRFWPEYVELNRQLATGAYGSPRSILATRRQAFPAWSDLFTRSDLTGGAVIDMMIHDYDAANWAMGQPLAVTARGQRNPRSGGFDQVQVLIDYGAGRSALIDGGMEMPDSYPFSSRFEVLADAGALEYHFRAGGRSFEEGEGVNQLTLFPVSGDATVAAVEQGDPFAAEVAYFAECVRTGAAPTRVTPEDALLALRVALAARSSLEQDGATVSLT
jgi:predicted dehydrogenase